MGDVEVFIRLLTFFFNEKEGRLSVKEWGGGDSI